MIQSVEAIIGRDGRILLGEIIKLEKPHHAIVTILEKTSVEEVSMLSEQAWAHLQ